MPYEVLWRYFAWCNQVLAVFTLWTLTVYLARQKRLFVITLIPAMFMTAVTVTYIMFAQEGIGTLTDMLFGIKIAYEWAVGIGLGVTALFTFMFGRYLRNLRRQDLTLAV